MAGFQVIIIGRFWVIAEEAQPSIAELFSKNSVLFLEVVDDILLLLVQVASKGNQQQSKWIQSQAHRASVPRRQRAMTRPWPPSGGFTILLRFKEIQYLDTTP